MCQGPPTKNEAALLNQGDQRGRPGGRPPSCPRRGSRRPAWAPCRTPSEQPGDQTQNILVYVLQFSSTIFTHEVYCY